MFEVVFDIHEFLRGVWYEAFTLVLAFLLIVLLGFALNVLFAIPAMFGEFWRVLNRIRRKR